MIRTGYRFPNDLLESVSEAHLSSKPGSYGEADLDRIDIKHGVDFYLKYPLLFTFDQNFLKKSHTFVKDGAESLRYFFNSKNDQELENFLIINPHLLYLVPTKNQKKILTYYIKDKRDQPQKNMGLILDSEKLILEKNLSEYVIKEDFDLNKIGISGIFLQHLVMLGFFNNSINGVKTIEKIEISPYHTLVVYAPDWGRSFF